MWDWGWFWTQPWWRPNSVACTVTSHGPLDAARAAARRRRRRASRASGRDRTRSGRTARRRARACRRSSPRPSARTRSGPSGTGFRAPRTRWTMHPVLVGLGRQAAAAAGQHVHLDAVADQVLGELAHVAAEAALDHGRVLPGDRAGRASPGGHPIESGRFVTPLRVVMGPQGSITPIAQCRRPDRPGRPDRPHPPAHGRHRPDPRLLRRRARVRRDLRGARRARLGHHRRHPVPVGRRLPPPPRLQHVEVEGRRRRTPDGFTGLHHVAHRLSDAAGRWPMPTGG